MTKSAADQAAGLLSEYESADEALKEALRDIGRGKPVPADYDARVKRVVEALDAIQRFRPGARQPQDLPD